MLTRLITILTVLLIMSAADELSAQEPEVLVGDIDFPEQVWGKQKLTFEVTNRTDWLKFLVVETDVTFEGSYVTPHRVAHTNFILEPSARVTIDPELEIPGNYGQMVLWVRVVDVVDTLDDMSLGTQILEQPFRVKFPAPAAVAPYFEKRLSLAPMVGNHGLFDNEFHRLVLLMTYEGKTVDEIMQICQVDAEYARWALDDLVGARVLRLEDEQYRPAIPVIDSDYAIAGRELADDAADRFATQITTNLAGRRPLMDSLARAGTYSNDSSNFIEGGTLLWQPYPLVAGLYLWQTLGQKFVAGTKPLVIFGPTDPCQAKIRDFHYMVQGGDYYVGHHYYSALPTRGGLNAHFGDRIPVVECRPGFEKKLVARQNVDWTYGIDYKPEAFVYDTTLINPMISLLDTGVEEILRSIAMDLRQLNAEHGYETLPVGTRYWFWNLTATRIVDRLVEAGTISRSGNGQYRFMEKRR